MSDFSKIHQIIVKFQSVQIWPNIEIFYEKVQKPYLKQVYDSKKNGFNYHVKVFEIDYKAYDIIQDNRDWDKVDSIRIIFLFF